ncbi:hypothetical protein Mal15_24390 [Stieleria maiorica]|uniref:Uncharacterized protein n=1 Tax=Stieleria maiorica TaxID=2795974 RepID=A0A5B9MH30_9BACT|nr:hypothetical protein [Stieleria maiorica]QEF98387.1 hypothetical protein Mal15_24390 [Stieleria maiorica]
MNAAIKNVAFAITLSLLTSATSGYAETSTTQLRQQTRKQLRLEATAASAQAQDDAAAALCDLYVVLRRDPRYGTSDMLQGDAAKVRKRLMTIARRREIQLGRKGIARPAALSMQVDSAIRAALVDQKSTDQEAGDQKSATPERNEVRTVNPVAGGGAAAGAGWQLVELIERIVAPDFWESRGGVGSIQYFAMRRVLVVRATSDVHQQVKDLLMALR